MVLARIHRGSARRFTKCLLPLALMLLPRTPQSCWVPGVAVCRAKMLRRSQSSVFHGAASGDFMETVSSNFLLLVFHRIQSSRVWETNSVDRHHTNSEFLSLLWLLKTFNRLGSSSLPPSFTLSVLLGCSWVPCANTHLGSPHRRA